VTGPATGLRAESPVKNQSQKTVRAPGAPSGRTQAGRQGSSWENPGIALPEFDDYIGRMKQADQFRLNEKYPGEFVATARKSGRPVAHAPSARGLYAVLKRKRIDPTQTIVEKTPPKDAVVIY